MSDAFMGDLGIIVVNSRQSSTACRPVFRPPPHLYFLFGKSDRIENRKVLVHVSLRQYSNRGNDGARMCRYPVGVSSHRAFHVTGMGAILYDHFKIHYPQVIYMCHGERDKQKYGKKQYLSLNKYHHQYEDTRPDCKYGYQLVVFLLSLPLLNLW